jgi:hypothetical protein
MSQFQCNIYVNIESVVKKMYAEIVLRDWKKNNEKACNYRRPFGRDSNLELFQYEAGELTTSPLYSFDS